jgi:hypothetical protein
VTDTRLRSAKVALLSGDDAHADAIDEVRARLESAGGTIVRIPEEMPYELAHPSGFGGLILLDAFGADVKPAANAVQMTREFMVADKPVAAIGSGVRLLAEADALTGRTVAAPDDLADEVRDIGGELADTSIHADERLVSARSGRDLTLFLEKVVRTFAAQVEERQLDQVSEQSFPASDPPPGPGAIGASGVVDRERESGSDARF